LSSELFMAFGLMLVLEGVLPLLAPKAWRETFQRMILLKDGQLRFIGLASILSGMLLMLFFR
jgi:uncharacterized protein YjeT (DUF2065 family)